MTWTEAQQTLSNKGLYFDSQEELVEHLQYHIEDKRLLKIGWEVVHQLNGF